MRKARRTSRRYRGARRGGIGVLIPVLIVLCIIAAGALYVINDNMAFTKDGTFFTAWGTKREPEEVDANLVIEDPSAESEALETNPQTPTAQTGTVQPQSSGKRAYLVPIGTVKSSELFDAAVAEIPADAAVNTLVLEVKAEDGTLAFGSEHEFVREKQIVGDDSVLSQAISKAKASGYKVALLVSCFKDNGAARNNFEHAVLAQGGGVWRDEFETRWLSPYSEKSRLYLADIIKKLTTLSPDEIILSNISFPIAGKTDMIVYDESIGTKAEMLKGFIGEAKEAAGNVPLSAVYENYNDAYRSKSGQEPEVFAEFGTVYINYKGDAFTQSFGEAEEVFEGAGCKLIPITADSSAPEFIMEK